MFDIAGAKQAGYSDAEIADYLGKDSNFDVAGARKAGYKDSEIVEHLSTPQKPTRSVLERGVELTKEDSPEIAALKGVGRGAVNVAGAIADTPQNLYQLGQAVQGVGSHIGIRPEEAPVLSERNKASKFIREKINDLVNLDSNTTDPTARFAGTASELATEGLMGGGGKQIVKAVVAPAVLGATGEQAAESMGLDPNLGKVAGMLTPLGVDAALGIVKRAARGPAQEAATNFEKFDQAGIQPDIASVAPSRASAQATMARIPVASNIANAASSRMAKQFEDRVDSLIATNANEARAGQTIQTGINDFKTKLSESYKDIDNQLDKILPKETLIFPLRTKIILEDLITPAAGAKASTTLGIAPELKARASALEKDMLDNGGGLSLEGMRKIRTEIADKAFSDNKLIGDVSQGQYKALYKALSEDIKRNVEIENPAAGQLIQAQNKLWEHGKDISEKYYDKLMKQADPERMFNNLISGSKNGSQEIVQALKPLDKSGRDIVSSAVIGKLGRNKDGEFLGINQFLSGWEKISPEAKKAITSGTTNPNLAKELDTLVDAAKLVRAGQAAGANPSGSAKAVSGVGTVWGLMSAAADTMKVLGAGTTMTLLMTHPNFVKWAVQSTKLPASEIASHLTRLNQIANKSNDPEFKGAVKEFTESVQNESITD